MSLPARHILKKATTTVGRTLAIQDRVAEPLRASNYSALHDISCRTSDDVVCLIGILPSHYLKQVAQEIAMAVEGVYLVIDRIEFCTPDKTRPMNPGRPGNLSKATNVPEQRIAFIEHMAN